MRPNRVRVGGVCLVLGLGLFVEPAAACPADSVESGTTCIDKYEASVWYVPDTEVNLIVRLRNGTVTAANLTSPGAVAAGVVQLGLAFGDLAAAGCPLNGNGCRAVYAASIEGVTPARFISWFQAAAAARNARKRLPTNQEWQVAALGTLDTGGADDGTTTCNTDDLAPGVTLTGSRSGCLSDVGAFDMVGNVNEWVADWNDFADNCTVWSSGLGGDSSCFGGPGSGGDSSLPGATIRGGDWTRGTFAGVFTVVVRRHPFHFEAVTGFRCAR